MNIYFRIMQLAVVIKLCIAYSRVAQGAYLEVEYITKRFERFWYFEAC